MNDQLLASQRVEAIDRAAEKCISQDELEYQGAVDAIEGCIGTKRIPAGEIAQRTGYVREMVTALRNLHKNYYDTGLAAPEELALRKKDWDDNTTKLGQLRQRAKELGLETWEGDGANGYRQRMTDFIARLDKMAELTTSSSTAITTADEKLKDPNSNQLDRLKATKDSLETESRRGVETNWPTAEWWELDKNREQYSFTFFTRSAAAGKLLYDAALAMAREIDAFNAKSMVDSNLEELLIARGAKPTEGGGWDFCVAGPRAGDGGQGDQMSERKWWPW